ncbi:MAG: microcystin dependent protein [Firmicutes bacterium]|nr:microcystin dependent protein [Bacillota bacterium]
MAFTDIDATTPTGTQKGNVLDDQIRELKTDIETNLAAIANYPGSSTPALRTAVWDTDGRPSGADLVDGVTGYNSDYGCDEHYDEANTAWVQQKLPAGVIQLYGGSSAPEGYLLCDGSAVSRTSYAELYAALGDSYGEGDGSTTFNVPDLQDKFPLGLGTSYATLAATGGEITHALTTDEMPEHTHDLVLDSIGGGSGNNLENGGWGGDDVVKEADVAKTTAAAGGGVAHNNMPPYLVVNYIIKW